MAANQQAAEVNDLTCSICVDIFRDPVTLQCGHNYCRECLQMFADASKATAKDNGNDAQTNEVMLSCPVCRSAVSLGSEGVAGLAVSQELLEAIAVDSELEGSCTPSVMKCSMCEGVAGLVVSQGLLEAVAVDSQSEASCMPPVTKCSMCEGDEKAEAVKVCSTCNILYCEECLPALHPMRGPLKTHTLISVEEYMSKGTESGSSQAEKSTLARSCPRHNKSFSDFCFSCQQLLCNLCLPIHTGHEVSDVTSAYDRRKKEMVPKLSAIQETKMKLMESDSSMVSFINDIQANEELHLESIRDAIRSAQQTLEKWGCNLAQAIKQRHRGLRLTTDGGRSELKIHTEAITGTLDKLTTTQMVEYLQDSTELISSGDIDKQLGDANESLTAQADIQRTNRDALLLDIVRPKQIRPMELFGERPLSTPKLQFIPRIMLPVRKIGRFRCLVDPTHTSRGISKSVNKKFMSGTHYWELDICVHENKVEGLPESVHVGLCSDDITFPNKPGTSSWGIQLQYRDHEYTCYNISTQDMYYRRRISLSKPHRIGFYLDCENKNLVIVDCHNNQVISSMREIAGQEFTPGVCLDQGGHIPVHIVDCDSSTIPNILREMLEKA